MVRYEPGQNTLLRQKKGDADSPEPNHGMQMIEWMNAKKKLGTKVVYIAVQNLWLKLETEY